MVHCNLRESALNQRTYSKINQPTPQHHTDYVSSTFKMVKELSARCITDRNKVLMLSII